MRELSNPTENTKTFSEISRIEKKKIHSNVYIIKISIKRQHILVYVRTAVRINLSDNTVCTISTNRKSDDVNIKNSNSYLPRRMLQIAVSRFPSVRSFVAKCYTRILDIRKISARWKLAARNNGTSYSYNANTFLTVGLYA